MKKKLFTLIIFASAGAMLHTVPMAFADDAKVKASRAGSEIDVQLSSDLDAEINEPAGAELKVRGDVKSEHAGQLKKASDLIGADVRNEQDEKLGDIRDLMVDVQSGQIPFAVLSTGGFFGVGGQLNAIPPSTFSQMADEDELVLGISSEQLRSAPSFSRNQWPDMSDRAWSSEVYSYYEAEPYWEQSATTEIREPAGAQVQTEFHDRDAYQYEAYSEKEPGFSENRRPRQGLGVEDLTRNEESVRRGSELDTRRSDTYRAESDAYRSDSVIRESAGAEKTYTDKRTMRTDKAAAHPGKVKRASELIGMEIKNAQNEHIGEIQDLVVDFNSGRVAYAVVDAGGFLDVSDKFYAVPLTVFTRSADERSLVFNTDQATLKASPSFARDNWETAINQQFTRQVYQHYRQEPYWQTGGTIREPSGAEQHKMKKEMKKDSSQLESRELDPQSQARQSESLQSDASQVEAQAQINEPAGATTQPRDTHQQEPRIESSVDELNEPAGAEPERYQSPRAEEQQQSSATRETTELEQPDEQAQTEIDEPAGATATATRQDQLGTASNQQLTQQVRSALQSDTALSSQAKNVRVEMQNGKITLQGTVASEQEKQAIADKVKEIAIDNQLRVQNP